MLRRNAKSQGANVTGRIETIGTEETPGSIRLANGVNALFETSEVLLYGTKGLAVGQLVTFDLEKGNPPKALNISLEKQHYTPHGTEKRPQGVRYLGFDQKDNVRGYKFESLSPEETQMVIVTVDMALFAKHRVGIQDGPALCLRLVMAEEWPPKQRSLTDEEMLAHLARRPVRAKASSGRWTRRAPKADSPWRGTRPRPSS